MAFIGELLISVIFLREITRPYTQIDKAVALNKYGRKLDAIQTFFLYAGIVTMLVALIICFSQRGTLLGLSATILVGFVAIVVLFCQVKTSFRLVHYQGERVRAFLDFYCDDVGLLKQEYMGMIYGTEMGVEMRSIVKKKGEVL